MRSPSALRTLCRLTCCIACCMSAFTIVAGCGSSDPASTPTSGGTIDLAGGLPDATGPDEQIDAGTSDLMRSATCSVRITPTTTAPSTTAGSGTSMPASIPASIPTSFARPTASVRSDHWLSADQAADARAADARAADRTTEPRVLDGWFLLSCLGDDGDIVTVRTADDMTETDAPLAPGRHDIAPGPPERVRGDWLATAILDGALYVVADPNDDPTGAPRSTVELSIDRDTAGRSRLGADATLTLTEWEPATEPGRSISVEMTISATCGLPYDGCRAALIGSPPTS